MIEDPVRVTDTVAVKPALCRTLSFAASAKCRTRMREIIPFAGIAIFEIDEEMEWNARTGPDHVCKALQSLALRH
jgi:hypothetical protein